MGTTMKATFFLNYQISNMNEFKNKYATDHIIMGGALNLTQDEWMDIWPSKYNYQNQISDFIEQNDLVGIWRKWYLFR